MNNFKKLLALFALIAGFAAAQNFTLTQTYVTAAVTATQNYITVNSATGFVSSGAVLVDQELMIVGKYYTTGTIIPVTRNSQYKSAHILNSPAMFGKDPAWFRNYDPYGSCTATAVNAAPWVNLISGRRFQCAGGQWGEQGMFFVPPTSCVWTPTTLTVTNTYPQIGASNIPVVNGVTNAAAGTLTLSCTFTPPTKVTTGRGSVLTDIVLTVGSQVVAPTSLGTSTLGTVSFPVPVATTQTASVVTPVAIGGTVTTLGPTTTVLSVTTAGAFLTFLNTYSTVVDLNSDRQVLVFTFPLLQSAASAMTLNSAGLFVHYQPRN